MKVQNIETNDTVRCFPRTLEEAFPWEPDNANAIQRYDVAPVSNTEWLIFLCAGVVLMCTIAILFKG